MSRQKGMGIGSVSLILIFSVLCMSVFALLSLAVAKNESGLSQRFADSAADYYAADAQAQELLWQIGELLESGQQPERLCNTEISYESQKGKTAFSYLYPIDEKRSIEVEAAWDGKALQLTRWTEVNTAQWSPQEDIDVFGG